MSKITLQGTTINYSIKYSNRTTIQLNVPSPDTLEIIAPPGCTKQYIEELLQKKAGWILKKTQLRKQLEAIPINKSLDAGSQLLYMGTPHLLIEKVTNGKSEVDLTAAGLELHLQPSTSAAERQRLLGQWYVDEASRYLVEITEFWAKKIGCQPKHISMRDQKTRWGSCSSRHSISYNWRIIMAPPPVIDYLVIHELCHILVPNHSAAFWRKVGEHMSDYKVQRSWLKQNGILLKQIL